MTRLLVTALVALLTHMFALPDASAAVVPSSSGVAQACDFRVQLAAEPGDVSERGRHAVDASPDLCTAVDRGSNGASARSATTNPCPTNLDAVHTTYTYDQTANSVRDDNGGAAGTEGTHAADGALSWLGRDGVAANTASRFGNLTHASSGIAPYSTLGAIVVTRAEHQVFTNAWRQAIPYGSRNVTPNMVNNSARTSTATTPRYSRRWGSDEQLRRDCSPS